MSKYPYFLRWVAFPLAAVLGMALTMTAQTPVLGHDTARLNGFTQADGTKVFALALKPTISVVREPRDVVILVSTAASQNGDYREKSLATLQSTLSKLDSHDRVKLVAFDLNAVPLTQEFVAPNSPQMAAGLAALTRRVPLGSCDLEKALQTAVSSFTGNSTSQRAILYIGDGSSRASLLTLDQLDRIADDLVSQRAPIIALAIGPQIEEQVLGVLAARSGGDVMVESAAKDANFYGRYLARAVHGSVLWPINGSDVKWPEGWAVYPRVLPPLRGDRDTVLVGTAKSTAAGVVEFNVAGPNGSQKLAWNIPDLKSDSNNSYLSTLVAQAKSDGGRSLPLTDSASLVMAKREIEAGGRGLSYFARQALAGGNFESARTLADEALRRDPGDHVARAIKDTIAKKADIANIAGPAGMTTQADKNVQVADPGDLILQGETAELPSPMGTASNSRLAPRQQRGRLGPAESLVLETRALEEQWDKDVQNTIDKARSQVTVDPGAAEAMIHQKIGDLAGEAQLRPEMRDRLQGILRTAAREIKNRKEEFVFREQRRIREAAARREQELANAALAHDQAKLKQLMDRYEWLMAEGRHRLAEESAALEAKKLVDRAGLSSAKSTIDTAMIDARLRGAYDDIMEVRVAKQKAFVDTLYQTEKAGIAMADDPPIVYQDAEVWKELTVRRKAKYSSTDLSTRSPAEKKIDEALKQPTQIEFIETPLKDVIDYLKDLHHIEIQLDLPALKEAGIDDSVPIKKNLKGISLRSALKLLLGDLQLTYVIKNEVLLITTPTKAESEEYMTSKVYPMADLVLPIQNTGFTGGFGNLGGRGNAMNSGPFGSLPGPGNQLGPGNPGNGNPPANANFFGRPN